MRANERVSTQVAIDGRARNRAKRMLVRKKVDFLSQFGWHHGRIIVPKHGTFRTSGFFISVDKEKELCKKKSPTKFI